MFGRPGSASSCTASCVVMFVVVNEGSVHEKLERRGKERQRELNRDCDKIIEVVFLIENYFG